uniref:Putative secreted protein n=1 Tax=Amblyomma tuberculatum TaxID=48802 RepID=A0A6M2E2B6_9ACAR
MQFHQHTKYFLIFFFLIRWRIAQHRDSNHGPLAREANALPLRHRCIWPNVCADKGCFGRQWQGMTYTKLLAYWTELQGHFSSVTYIHVSGVLFSCSGRREGNRQALWYEVFTVQQPEYIRCCSNT